MTPLAEEEEIGSDARGSVTLKGFRTTAGNKGADGRMHELSLGVPPRVNQRRDNGRERRKSQVPEGPAK